MTDSREPSRGGADEAWLESQAAYDGPNAVYLTARMGVGQSLALGSIDRRLALLPFRQSLLLLSEMALHADRSATKPLHRARQIELAKRIFPSSFLSRAEAQLSRGDMPCVALSSQITVLLGVRMLAVGDRGVPELRADELARRLGALCLALGDHVDQGRLDTESTILEFVRLGLFYRQAEHDAWLAVSSRLYFEVLPELADHPQWMAPHERFAATARINLERFWALTALQGLVARTGEHFLFPITVQEYPPLDSELDAWRALLASPLASVQQLALGDLESPPGWSMSAVWKRPIIDLGDGRGPALRSSLVEMQSEPCEMFWHVRDQLVSDGIKHTSWSNLYGDAVEMLGLRLLSETCEHRLLFDEARMVDEWSVPAGARRADAAVVSDDGALVVIDFVCRQFTKDTTTTGDFQALTSDLRRGVIEKLVQIDDTFGHAAKAGFQASRLYPVVVLAGPFPMNPLLDIVIAEELKTLNLGFVNVDGPCRPWVAIDLASFLVMLTVVRERSIPLEVLLEDWQRSKHARHTFRHFAFLDDGPAVGLAGGGVPNVWEDHIFEVLRRHN